MGHSWWGTPLAKQNGFYEYGVSPYQLKTFKGMINPGLPQYVIRTGKQLAFIVPPMVAFYLLAKWADKKVDIYITILANPHIFIVV